MDGAFSATPTVLPPDSAAARLPHAAEKLSVRLAFGVVHALVNAFVVMVAGKHFSWERFGRMDIFESGKVLLLVAFVMSIVTIVFWIVPVRRRFSGAAIVTASAVVATAIGTLLLEHSGSGMTRRCRRTAHRWSRA